ncbi:MAG: FAD-dependent oxidoreductase [Candidatus Omnitrophica bacterium]|nr:FAD-dependent oxidoreductase [Candidatus Omnitrophota bacterium]
MASTVILGAGITGLCAGHRRRRIIYEGLSAPGGLCASYYIGLGDGTRLAQCYRFEKGGGHWIFGNDEKLLDAVKGLSPVKVYSRKASVYFPDRDLYVPYPIQNHSYAFPAEIRRRIRDEIGVALLGKSPETLQEWLISNFGRTLGELFFLPFHSLYTAGLTAKIATQDQFKNPVDRSKILRGLKGRTLPSGYNTTFVYPRKGLDHFIGRLEKQCDVRYNKRAVRIDIARKMVFFQDGSEVSYKKLISTIPLDEMIKLCGLRNLGKEDPYTSVLVLNIGAQRGSKCPKDHWVYIPKSLSGFHRVGFYSNVDASFLPKTDQQKRLVSIYVEKAFLPKDRPKKGSLERLSGEIVAELKAWQYINGVEVVSPTWIDHAYTWRRLGSTWREDAIGYLRDQEIHSIGRYGAWRFQGILESMRDGYLS